MSGWAAALRGQAANAITLLAILPLVVVTRPDSASLLPAALLFADAVDSLDGVVARTLGTSSAFGAQLDLIANSGAQAEEVHDRARVGAFTFKADCHCRGQTDCKFGEFC